MLVVACMECWEGMLGRNVAVRNDSSLSIKGANSFECWITYFITLNSRSPINLCFIIVTISIMEELFCYTVFCA